jgi:hypothetical protein
MHATQIRRAHFPVLEESLLRYVQAMRRDGAVVTGITILNKARALAQELNVINFVGSRGWLFNFLRRHNLVLRRITSGGKQLPINTKQIIRDFHERCMTLRIGLNRSEIFNADETSIQLDSYGNYSYETKGSKNIYATSPGHEKVKISVCLICSADGTILPPVIIVPRKHPIKNYTPPSNVIVYYKQGSKTFDSAVFTEGVIRRAFYPYILRNNIRNPLLFIDNAPCHKTDEVKKECDLKDIRLEHIPPRMTCLLQPLDVSIMRSFKSKYHTNWRDWYLNSDKSFTASGNMKSPSYITVINIKLN